ncbi:MAG: hypothetical protein GYB67_07820 [Chloroflexi bacterium]|nr:hypothetical protein [Chloroflexota bacterium]
MTRARWSLLAAGIVVLVAAILRLHLLGAQSLWHDEGNSVVQAARSFSEIAANAARDIHPPGYYWLLMIWRGLSGESEFALRALSALASISTVALTYAIGRRLFGPLAGIVAALIAALNTFNIYYAQEARMYALLALWAAGSLWALVNLLTTRRFVWRWAAFAAICTAAGLWTHYGFPLTMLAGGVIVVIWAIQPGAPRRPTRLIAYTAANLAALIAFLPWLPTAWAQISGWPNPAPPEAATALIALAQTLIFGITRADGLSIAALLLIFGLVSRARWWRASAAPIWFVVPAALFVIIGLALDDLKSLLPAQIGVALWLGRGVWILTTLRLRVGGALIPRAVALLSAAWLIAALAGGLPALYHDPAHQRADYRALAADITAALRPGDAVILNAPNQIEVFAYYFDAAAPIYPLPQGLNPDPATTRAAVEAIIAGHERAFAVFWGDAERDPGRVVETTLDAGAFELTDRWYGDVRLSRYVMPAPLTVDLAVDQRLGQSIRLIRAALNTTTITAGDVLQLRLTWTTDTALAVRYKVFVQLLDAGGVLVAQRDSEPGGGLALTTTWTPGAAILDNHALLIPRDLPPGDYALIVGLYDLNDPSAAAARLTTPDGGDFIDVATITVE